MHVYPHTPNQSIEHTADLTGYEESEEKNGQTAIDRHFLGRYSTLSRPALQ